MPAMNGLKRGLLIAIVCIAVALVVALLVSFFLPPLLQGQGFHG